MLSSQTKDEVTDAAIKKLRTALGGSITVEALISADEETVSNAINKVGFWRRKTGCVSLRYSFRNELKLILSDFRYIKKAAQMLQDDFDGDVPKTVDELCSLPGVGPKMAFLALQVAWKLYVKFAYHNVSLPNDLRAYRNSGIGVDVHVHRITNRLGWHKPPTKNPEETRCASQ
jgi:endonuclease III